MENKYLLYASDFDNTLVPLGERRPRPALEREVKRLKKQGVKFVICTGRSLSALKGTKEILGSLKYDYAVCNNGAHVVDANDQTICKTPLTNEEMYALVDFCEDYDYPLQFAFSDGYYAYVGYEESQRIFRQLEQSGTGLRVLDGEDQDRHLTEIPVSAFLMFPPDGLERFQAQYGYLGLEFLKIANVYQLGDWCSYDVMHQGIDKGKGLQALCADLDIPMEQVVATGDGNNDLGMIRAAGLGCAMGNAAPALKQAADRILPDVQGEGVVPLLQELWPCAKD